MALLDFIKNRNPELSAPKPAPETPKPELKKDIGQTLSQSDMAKVKEIGERLQKATAHVRGGAEKPAAGDSNSALLQKQNNQEKTQAALSPTDQFKGQAAPQQRARGWER